METASLEELLAEEGFKRGKIPPRSSRSSLKTYSSMPVHLYSGQSSATSEYSEPNVGIRTERTRSDVSKLGSKSELRKNERAGGRRSRKDIREIERLILESNDDMPDIEIDEGIASNHLHEDDVFYVRSSRNSRESLMFKVVKNPEFRESPKFDASDWKNMQHTKGRFLNEFQECENLKDKYLGGFEEREVDEHTSRKNSEENVRNRSVSSKHMGGKKSSVEGKSSLKKYGELQNQRHLIMEEMVSEPALDEVAIRAMISILTSYVGRFLKDNNFRLVFRRNCMSCLNFSKTEKECRADGGVALSLKHAIERVERVTEALGSVKELKKAAIQLSIIAGLNSKDLKDGFTSGIPNLHLAACAHLYLSVIYKLQRKDRISAKHLLQVFCCSPLQARTTLLPDLWDHLFLPHLSHLRVWYDQEAEAIAETDSRPRKMKLLEQVYNEILDTGTYQFAFYYKEWLTVGTEAPPIPSIHIPKTSVCGVSCRGSHELLPDLESSPAGSVSSQLMISKRLYEAVFGHNNKLASPIAFRNAEKEEKFSASESSFIGTPEEKDRLQTPDIEIYPVQHAKECFEKDTIEAALLSVDGLFDTSENTCLSHQAAAEVKDIAEESDLIKVLPNKCASIMVMHKDSNTTANELTLKKLAKAAFNRQTDDSSDSSDADPLHSKNTTAHDMSTDPCRIQFCLKCDAVKTRSNYVTSNVDLPVMNSIAGSSRNREYFEINHPFFSSVPKDFICPLTGQLFEDPVTIETGQTFEREAFKQWLGQGNETCPVTGRKLASRAIPVANFILKRVVDGWKSEQCRNLLVSATQIAGKSIEDECNSKDEAALLMIEKLLISCNSEERTENAKHFLSIGGLQFLIQRFELGDLEEKTLVAALMSCCVSADGGCRNYLAQSIKRSSLIELLHSKEISSRTTAVFLLTELICLNRRTVVMSFLNGLQKEGIINTLHILLVYLQSCTLDQKPMISVLILHFDLLVEPRKYSIYREEAVDALIAALYCSLVDQQVKEQCCRAILILGAHFSCSGEISTETWLLKHAGYNDDHNNNSLDEDNIHDDMAITQEEEKAREEWLKNLAALLLGNGKKSFLESISKCVICGSPDLVRVCLITVAWLSRSLASMPDAGFQLSAFSSLIHPLKQNLENEQVEDRVLASLSLFNFCEISECRVLLMTFADEIVNPLHRLTEITWTAKHLHSVISGD